VSMNGGIHAFRKSGQGLWIIERFNQIAGVETNMVPTHPLHRHDQPILSVLLYQAFGEPLFADFATYAGWRSPREVVNQKVWVHRTRMLDADQDYFIRALTGPALPRVPDDLPPARRESWLRKARVQVAKWRGRYPRNKAGEAIDDGVKD
jgi:hypothetical protein